MSKAKQLSYDMEEPAFLRRLRANPNYSSDQNRVIAPRNKKQKLDDDEDAPTYVLEDGASVTHTDFKALQEAAEKEAKEKEEAEGKEEEKKDDEVPKNLPKEKEAGIGGRKRKGGIVVGRDEDDEEIEEKVGEARKKAEALLGERSKVQKGEEKEKVKPKLKAKGKKKKDAVKLSFGDD
ncbi:hypothetical protein BJ508DRAFT_125092 [Ascobolus immersus RN42]|uniref:DUF4604 domain-containing protein n=1 Tax=Ascobolus immersus RN42 TaxID=1160509 RepID=A0A3N4I968_ASCIM|nr:hypothetical protein BJ508DRAFT_125092 [Ascobolus immersus RN42]